VSQRQPLVHVPNLQVDGPTELDGGATIYGPLVVNNLAVTGLFLPAIEGTGVNLANLLLVLPRIARTLLLEIEASSDQAAGQAIALQFNGDAGASQYEQQFMQMTNGVLSSGAGTAQTTGRCGMIGTNGMGAGMIPYSQVSIGNADSRTQRKPYIYRAMQWATDAGANATMEFGQGFWKNTTDPIRTILFLPTAGLFAYIRARVYLLS
jgi:hypothetical protein